MPVTSQWQNTDLIIGQWAEAALNVSSGIKGQICIVEVRLVRKVVGQITAPDRAALDALLRLWHGFLVCVGVTAKELWTP